MAERLARNVLGNVEGYWPANEFADQRVALAVNETWVIPQSFGKILIDCDKEATLKFGWTQGLTTVEILVKQVIVMSGPLPGAFLRNDGAADTPDVLVRVLTMS